MRRIFGRIYTYMLLIFLYAPVIIMAVYSFNESRTSKIWGGFSLKWYISLFSNKQILTALTHTLIIAAVAMIISTIIGTLAAVGISGLGKYSKKTIMAINYLGIINPDIIIGVSLMLLFTFMDLNFGFLTMFISHITFCIPFVVISVMPVIKKLNTNTINAAYDLGAKPLYTLRKVIIPQIRPGIITGALLAFTLSLDDFVVSFFTTGSGVTNLSIYVYTSARRGISPEINALSVLMLTVVFTLLVAVNLRMLKTERKTK